MRKTTIFILFALCAMGAYAQEESDDSLTIQAVFDACVAMRDAAATNDTASIMQAAEDLKNSGVRDFGNLRCKDDTLSSLNGHLVFSGEFADSLAKGRDAYSMADDINRSSIHRGQTANGSILTKTCFVKVGKSTKYSFASKGRQELAVVAEAGGLVTMKVHATNRDGLDKRFDDTKNVKKGQPHRKVAFNLPSDRRNTVEVEILNRGKKDCSFVIISN